MAARSAAPNGLRDRPRPGRPPCTAEGRRAAFKAMVPRGPDPERDGVSAWRIADLCRFVEERFGLASREGGMTRLGKVLDLSSVETRPATRRPTGPRRSGSKGETRGGAG